MYSRIFQLHEATVLSENPGNPQQIVYKKLLWVEFLESSYLEWALSFMLNLNFTKNADMWKEYVFANGLNSMPAPPSVE